jgi:hypothetical protein
MIPHGIPVAQLDSNLEGDPKFLRLRMKAPGLYYAALGTYTSIVLRAWATASRVPDPDLLALMDETALALLREFSLLDESSSIPERVFEKWPGSVLTARAVEAERKRNVRRTPPDSDGVVGSPQESDDSYSTLLSSSSSTPTTTPRGDDGGVQGGVDRDPVVTYFTLTTRYPKGNALAWCKRLGDTYGFIPSSEAMWSAWAESDAIGTLLSRTEDYLVAAERAAELREKADEKERLRQKRAAVRLPQVIVDPDPERVDAIMGDIRAALR